MKRLLLPLLAALALPTACSNVEVSDKTVNAKIDPKIRKACLRAADFEGCVIAYTNPKEKKNNGAKIIQNVFKMRQNQQE